jgi:hypothetical protein
MRLASTTTVHRTMTPPDARYKTARQRQRGKRPRGGHATGGQRAGDSAGQWVAFFVAAHVWEHSLILALRQSALKMGVLALAMASGHAVAVVAGSSSGLPGWPGPKDPPPPRRHQAGFPLRRQRHGTGALAVTAAGSVSGREPEARHRPGDRDIP